MSNKANIFASLPQHQSDSDDEGNNKTKPRSTKQASTRAGGPGPAPLKNEKEEHHRQKEARKDKGVSGQPHPLDRHSGTGNQAYGAKAKKSGAGKGNWGSYRDDKRPGENLEERQQGAEEGEADVKPLEEEKPSLTLQEYYQQQNFGKAEQQVNEAKAKITSEQLMKEMGTATMLKSRHQQEVDDRKVGKKKSHLDVDHRAAIATEHGDLLGFRTGFIEKEYKQRGAEGASPTKPAYNKGGRREPREQENAKEEEAKPETQAGATAQPGAQEGQAEGAGEGQQAGAGQERRQEGGSRGGRGGQRGGGNRPQGERRPQGGKQGEAAKLDLGDSAFPKLG